MNTTAHGVPVAVEYRNGKEWVDARELHAALGSSRQFANWIRDRIEQCRLEEGKHYEVFNKAVKNPSGGRPATDYRLTVGIAVHVAMMENTDVGFQIRDYFIEVEDAARALAAKFQALGGTHQVMTYALMGRVYQLFANSKDADLKTIFHILELSLAKSALTGEYIMAKDVAVAMRGGEMRKGAAMSEGWIETKVTEIRRLVEDFGFVPTMVRLPNGNYKAVPLDTEAEHA